MPEWDETLKHTQADWPEADASETVTHIPEDNRTRLITDAKEDFKDVVTGWLVCIEGVNQGKDYRIGVGRNSIGRTKGRIRISGDDAISRENHGVVRYDPRSNSFRLIPGDSSGLIFLNKKVVDVAEDLKAGDVIELGQSSFRFVPLCGADFRWYDL